MNYLEFSAENFAANESFQNYYFFKKKESILFWEKWIKENPSKIAEVEAAKELLDVLFVEVSPQEVQDALSELKQTMAKKSTSPKRKITIQRRRFFQLFGSAAAALLLLVSAFYFLWQKPNVDWSITKTAFGERKEMQLPDGSLVYLNSNSQLKYDVNWPQESKREVWLEGEAFFNVNEKPTKGAQPFIVHSNETKVEVLGTVFSVYNRKENIAVVLESGKVRVNYPQAGGAGEQIMLPNERFELDADGNSNHRKAINTQLYTAWKDSKLVLDETPLEKVVDILEDNFGFHVTVKNDGVLQRKLTATIPIIDIEILLDALREIYGLKIKKEDQKIWIE